MKYAKKDPINFTDLHGIEGVYDNSEIRKISTDT